MAAAAFNGGRTVQCLGRCPTARRWQGGRGKEEDSDTLIKLMRRLAADVNGDDRRQQAAMGTGGSSRGSGSGTFGGSGGRRLRW